MSSASVPSSPKEASTTVVLARTRAPTYAGEKFPDFGHPRGEKAKSLSQAEWVSKMITDEQVKERHNSLISEPAKSMHEVRETKASDKRVRARSVAFLKARTEVRKESIGISVNKERAKAMGELVGDRVAAGESIDEEIQAAMNSLSANINDSRVRRRMATLHSNAAGHNLNQELAERIVLGRERRGTIDNLTSGAPLKLSRQTVSNEIGRINHSRGAFEAQQQTENQCLFANVSTDIPGQPLVRVERKRVSLRDVTNDATPRGLLEMLPRPLKTRSTSDHRKPLGLLTASDTAIAKAQEKLTISHEGYEHRTVTSACAEHEVS